MNNGFHHTDEAIKQRGEVFTPTALVNDMLGKLPPEVFTDPAKTFLDNSCGNAQFLDAVLERKLSNGISHKQALSTIYGCELDPKNAEECRKRLLRGSTSKELKAIVDHNIITADALDPNHPGWQEVGFYWDDTLKAKTTSSGSLEPEGNPYYVSQVMEIENGEVPPTYSRAEQMWKVINPKARISPIKIKNLQETLRRI